MDYSVYAKKLREAAFFLQSNRPDLPDVIATYKKSADVIDDLLCKAGHTAIMVSGGIKIPEYIARKAVLSRAISAGLTDAYGNLYGAGDVVLVDDIKDIPAADVELVRHGRWLDGKCTVCGWEEPDTYGYDGYETETWEETLFCPNCGAKMDMKT